MASIDPNNYIQELDSIKGTISEHDLVDVFDRIYGNVYAGDDLMEFNKAIIHFKINFQ